MKAVRSGEIEKLRVYSRGGRWELFFTGSWVNRAVINTITSYSIEPGHFLVLIPSKITRVQRAQKKRQCPKPSPALVSPLRFGHVTSVTPEYQSSAIIQDCYYFKSP